MARFIILGALLFGARALLPDAGTLRAQPIRVAAADVERLRAEWLAETRRYPTADELAASVRRFADEEMLLREALRLGLDRTDPVVRSRLVQNLRFAHHDPQADEGAMFAEALALGMGHRDLVARRRLVQAMEERLAADLELSDDEVRAYVVKNRNRYASPGRISFRHVFVSADRHRDDLEEVAAAIGARLASVSLDEAAELSEPFLLGQRFEAQSASDIARSFGAKFAQAMAELPEREWSGPLRSPYGLHFIYVEGREAETDPKLLIHRQAYYALLEQREREVVRDQVVRMRERYPVEIEGPVVAMGTAP